MMMMYNREQSRPSPLGMRSYESIDAHSPTFGTDVFLHHDGIDVDSQPCFSGDRVRSYDNVLNLRKYICDMSRAFTHLFDSNGIGVNANHIVIFNEYCSATDSKQFFTAAYKFQRKAVIDWNPNADGVTMSFNMGVDPLIPGHGQTMPRSVSFTRQHHLNVAREPSWLS
jgi:hypothetical protein